MDQRRYNTQRTNEVAVVFRITADGEIPKSYVTIEVQKLYKTLVPWIQMLNHGYIHYFIHMILKDGIII